MQIVATTVEIGPMFAGDVGPDIDFILVWDSGGYVDLTGALVTCRVFRWDPRRKVPLAAEITEGVCTLGVADRGEATFSWAAASPVSAIPDDAGWYMAQVQVDFSTGISQRGQRVVFEVMPT